MKADLNGSTTAETATNRVRPIRRQQRKGFVDDQTLRIAGYEEIIDIFDDGEMVLTRFEKPSIAIKLELKISV